MVTVVMALELCISAQLDANTEIAEAPNEKLLWLKTSYDGRSVKL